MGLSSDCTVSATPRLARGQVRRDGRLERHRVDLGITQRQRTLGQQCQRIGVAQAFGGDLATGSHRLAGGGAFAGQARGMQQAGGDGGLADIGIGAGDEISGVHRGFSSTAYTTW
jgi:hypothetical protein